ncbi:MAG TPA: tetratricopeptide repeat protein [Longimicrobiales bacterium]|nr:tetratricopeptide repeat protein [Longimicrobiales bacterium]
MKLKDEARRFEQTEDWDRAIELYRRALEQEAGDGELGLYNRIGDLYLRLGQTESAVDYYVQAADRYAESGFLNNAIALCNKALRYDADRIPLYEKLGRLCADQGFLTDARRWFLEYAERLAAAGSMDESLGALQEFAELSQDADVWAQLGRQYASQGRNDNAMSAFGRAADGYAQAGDEDAIDAVAAEARALDPSFTPPAASSAAALDHEPAAEPPSAPEEGGLVYPDDATAIRPIDTSAEPVAELSAPGDGYETDLVDLDEPPAMAQREADLADGPPEDLGLDAPADLDALGPVGGDSDERAIADVVLGDVRDDADADDYTTLSVESLLSDEPAYAEAYGAVVDRPAEADPIASEDAGSRPPLAEDDGPMPMPEWTDVARGSSETGSGPMSPVIAGDDALDGDEDDIDDLPLLDVDASADPLFATGTGAEPEAPVAVDDALDLVDPFDADQAVEERIAAPTSSELLEDLPALGDAEEVAAPPTAEAVEPPVAEAMAPPAASEDALVAEIPEEFAAPRTPEERARAMIAEGRVDDALDVLEHAAGAAQERDATHDAVRLADLMAELAPRSLRAMRLRADMLERAGDGSAVEALSALARRLGDAGDAEAARSSWQRVVGLDPAHAEAREALAAAGGGDASDYVDLAALVGDAAVETTRFVVEEEVPSGDEDQDFHEMLSQFRSKVSEHVSVEDTASHYDLGIAFKEMGLLDEAIAEFQTALRFGSHRLKVYEELGQCFMEKGDYAIAEKLLRQGANDMATDPNELLGVNYHLGRCYEELQRPDDAREAYERVLSLDIDFRDVSERLERL